MGEEHGQPTHTLTNFTLFRARWLVEVLKLWGFGIWCYGKGLKGVGAWMATVEYYNGYWVVFVL